MLLALAVVSTVFIDTQPVPVNRDNFMNLWIFLGRAVSITTIWILYAKLA